MRDSKPADQATFQWTSPLPFYDLDQRKYMCIRIFYTQLELKQNVLQTNKSNGKTYGLNHMSAWLRSNSILVVPIWR